MMVCRVHVRAGVTKLETQSKVQARRFFDWAKRVMFTENGISHSAYNPKKRWVARDRSTSHIFYMLSLWREKARLDVD